MKYKDILSLPQGNVIIDGKEIPIAKFKGDDDDVHYHTYGDVVLYVHRSRSDKGIIEVYKNPRNAVIDLNGVSFCQQLCPDNSMD